MVWNIQQRTNKFAWWNSTWTSITHHRQLENQVNNKILQDRHVTLDELHIAFQTFLFLCLVKLCQNILVTAKFLHNGFPGKWVTNTKHREWLQHWHFWGGITQIEMPFLIKSLLVMIHGCFTSPQRPTASDSSGIIPHLPRKLQKFKQTLWTWKIMATFFWDRVFSWWISCQGALQSMQMNGMLSCSIVIFHDHVCSYRDLLDQFGWEICDHPAHSLDLAPNDFHLFTKLKESLDRKHFGSDDELKNAVNNWLKALMAANY